MGVLIFRALIDLYISHDELVSVNNFLRQYSDMKEEIKNQKTLTVFRPQKISIYL